MHATVQGKAAPGGYQEQYQASRGPAPGFHTFPGGKAGSARSSGRYEAELDTAVSVCRHTCALLPVPLNATRAAAIGHPAQPWGVLLSRCAAHYGSTHCSALTLQALTEQLLHVLQGWRQGPVGAGERLGAGPVCGSQRACAGWLPSLRSSAGQQHGPAHEQRLWRLPRSLAGLSRGHAHDLGLARSMQMSSAGSRAAQEPLVWGPGTCAAPSAL